MTCSDTETEGVVDFAEGFDGTLQPGQSPVVLCIDLMRAYFDEQSPLCLPSPDCLGVAAEILAAARRSGAPVVHTLVGYSSEDDGGVFIRKIPALRLLVGDSPMGQPMPEVAPLADEPVIVKQYASAFFGTDLADMLHALGADTVILVGTSTSGCIRATAVDAIQHGFIPLVVSDGVGDRDEAVHRASLYDLQAKYAEVVDARAVKAYLAALRPASQR